MNRYSPGVAIVDDDASVRQALARLLRTAGHDVDVFDCASEFLRQADLDALGCLVLDVRLPDLDGLELQGVLDGLQHAPPIVFLTGHGDIPMTVRAMRQGAVDFLTKPCHAEELLGAVGRALDADAERRSRQRSSAAARARLASLTRREKDVLGGVAAGLLNKQIAAELAICEKTVKVHRAHVMEKMGVRSVADLVRLYQQCGLPDVRSTAARSKDQ